MKRAFIIVVALTLSVPITTGVLAKRARERVRDIVVFGTMYAVDGPFLGESNAIRGVVGDEFPWTIAHTVRGKLDTKGRLRIRVRGLVFTDDDEVPPELRGKNDEAEFRALVSCLSEEGDTVVTTNVTTAGFPATESGDATIDAKIDLPQPCVVPIIFILAGSEEKWVAVTGFETSGARSPRPTPASTPQLCGDSSAPACNGACPTDAGECQNVGGACLCVGGRPTETPTPLPTP